MYLVSNLQRQDKKGGWGDHNSEIGGVHPEQLRNFIMRYPANGIGQGPNHGSRHQDEETFRANRIATLPGDYCHNRGKDGCYD